MRVVTLLENSPGAPGCSCEHGLSFYIETKRHRILSDTGASGAFVENAAALGVDLKQVDAVFLSHGHYDHAGGILSFARVNSRVPIYMQHTAALPCYALDPDGSRYIGMDARIADLPQVRLLDGDAVLDEELSVLSKITGRRRWPASNLRLRRKEGDSLVQDPFDHEQALAVRQGDRFFLFSGCTHNGILNVLDRFREAYGQAPDVVFSGFHFMKKEEYTQSELNDIRETARELSRMDTVFYTGHCTGRRAFALMKEEMGERLHPLHTGLEVLWEGV